MSLSPAPEGSSTTTIAASGERHQPIPIPLLLLKTRSTPLDGYETYFSSNPLYRPIFVPVLSHTFNLDAIRTVLVSSRLLTTHYSGLIFTSQRAVEAFGQALEALGEVETTTAYGIEIPTSEILVRLKSLTLPLYTVGPATSRALCALRDAWLPHCTVEGAKTGNGEKLANYILANHGGSERPRKPLLFFVGEQRRDIIPKTLMDPTLPVAERIEVVEQVVYETSVMQGFAEDFKARLEELKHAENGGKTSSPWVVIFSPTGCEAMLRVLGWMDGKTGKVKEVLTPGDVRVSLASIGPTTEEYLLQEFGAEVDVTARTPSPEGLGLAIEESIKAREELLGVVNVLERDQ